MANYRQAKLAVHTFRCLASTTVTRPEPISRVYSTKASSLASKPAKFPGFSPYSYSILHNSVPHKTQLRCYHADPVHLVEWFHGNWFWVLITPVPFWVGSWVYPLPYGSYLCAKNGTFETLPYTKRRHLVVVSYSREKELGDKYIEESKNSKYKGKIMPANHPQSVRINQIANNIIDALKRSESVQALVELNWEFLVVDDPIVDASALAGGKIVVYTGLLEHLASDAEVAMIIAHEVGHVVARHQSEWRAYMEEFLVQMLKLRLTDSTVVALFFFFRRHCCRSLVEMVSFYPIERI